jgi:transcriptional regulator with XRE-family HTH domain
MTSFAVRLRHQRDLKKLTQEDLANRAGISLRLLQKYESGATEPSLGNVTKLARELEVSIDYLAGATEDAVAPGLSPIERFVISLMRRGPLPKEIEAAINESLGKGP